MSFCSQFFTAVIFTYIYIYIHIKQFHLYHTVNMYSNWLQEQFCKFYPCTRCICGPGSSVGIATDYGLDGPGSNPGGDEISRPSRSALGPTQPPVKWLTGLSRGVKCGRGVLLTTHTLLVLRSWKSRAIPLPTLWATPGL